MTGFIRGLAHFERQLGIKHQSCQRPNRLFNQSGSFDL